MTVRSHLVLRCGPQAASESPPTRLPPIYPGPPPLVPPPEPPLRWFQRTCPPRSCLQAKRRRAGRARPSRPGGRRRGDEAVANALAAPPARPLLLAQGRTPATERPGRTTNLTMARRREGGKPPEEARTTAARATTPGTMSPPKKGLTRARRTAPRTTLCLRLSEERAPAAKAAEALPARLPKDGQAGRPQPRQQRRPRHARRSLQGGPRAAVRRPRAWGRPPRQ
mmetsp:Transcript_9517/g.28633  ORF Transcript_9517/g.28633 Transcript_9517/m.28633 type:complete len:225 (-) Transcript_9517:89-763(-)